MAVKPQIFLIPDRPIFSKETSTAFETFSKQDSLFLYSALYANYADIFSKLKNDYEITYFFLEKDKEYLPQEFQADEIQKKFFNSNDAWSNINRQVEKKTNAGPTNILLIFANSIGISPNEISRIFNLLNYDDNNVVLGKSRNNYIAFIGVNYFENMLFNNIESFFIKYDEYLKCINRTNSFLFIRDGYQTIKDLNDFKELYKLLSTKESIEFCSHEIHELFTQLFIEYKELL